MKNINKIKGDIYREIVERTVDGREYSDEELYELIEEKVLKKSHEVYIAQSEKESITKSVYNSMRGMDVLQELIDNPDITEIMVNGPDNIFVENSGKIEKYPERFMDVHKLEALVELEQDLRIVLARGRCHNITKEEVHQLIDDIYMEYE